MAQKLAADMIMETWNPVIDHKDLPKIEDTHRRAVTARLLQNQQDAMDEQRLHEAPVNVTGAGVDNWDPILISMVRRAMPKLIAYDVFGVQPMTGPTGLIFAMRSRYDTQAGTEALFNEADSTHSGSDTAEGAGTPDPALDNPFDPNWGYGVAMATATAEGLGDDTAWNEMGFSIEKSSVVAKSRGLKATYSVELAQDLKAIHGLNADAELANILSTEMLAEMNREVIRRAYYIAQAGAQTDTATAGVFDLDVDSNGRWSVERFKGLMFQIERDANQIAKNTRRGKGNFIITSADVASALAMTGLLDNSGSTSLSPGVVDVTGSVYVGMLNSRTKVFVDPYLGVDAVLVGYKGSNAYDAGAFYCPYVPLTLYRATGENSFQPRMGFKTRYGMAANPFAGDLTAASNPYFRIFQVTNLV